MPQSTVTKTAPPEGSHKEFVESILVAFILAFIFRAFVVEAFVIPTGSMAPTLYGAHMRYRCPDCGFTFDVGVKTSGEDEPDIPTSAKPGTDYHCPNCGYQMNGSADQPVRFGDRILVLKYLYLFQKPQPWDVVVFKSPDEQRKHVREDPDYGVNYIKRLIATGPASVVILDGDAYVAPAYSIKTVSETGTTATVTTADPHHFSAGQPVLVNGAGIAEYNGTFTITGVINATTFTYTAAPGLTESSGGTVTAGTPPPWKDEPPFKIQRKPKCVQDALWRPVYNNDFVPHLGPALHAWTQPWQEETASSGWMLSRGATKDWPDQSPSRVFEFSNPQGGGAIAFHSGANPRPGPSEGPNAQQPVDSLSDFLVYDEAEHRDYYNHFWRPVYVSDLKLSCDYTRRSGDGPLRLQLSKKADLFTAEFTPGKVRLLRAQRVPAEPSNFTNKETVVGAKALEALSGSDPVRVELINVDYRVSVRVNDKEVIATTDGEYHPKVQELWEQESRATQNGKGAADQGPAEFAKPIVRIDAQRQNARVEHLAISRDIYYLSIPGNGRGTGDPFWATVTKIMNLNAGEYFVMGDNSFISGDARYWETEIDLPHEKLYVESGRVPDRFMLGKAFFVYWPAGYRLPFTTVNAVPDFGEVRFIR